MRKAVCIILLAVIPFVISCSKKSSAGASDQPWTGCDIATPLARKARKQVAYVPFDLDCHTGLLVHTPQVHHVGSGEFIKRCAIEAKDALAPAFSGKHIQ